MAEKYIAQSSAIAARLIGGEMMIMSVVDSTFFTLNEVATLLWQAADGRTSLSEIVDKQICRQFCVAPDLARRDPSSLSTRCPSMEFFAFQGNRSQFVRPCRWRHHEPLLAEMNQKALAFGIPISVHLDITYRCNERCIHCYLDHDHHGELSTEELRDLLTQLAEARVLFLTLSGGEVLMRRDFFAILEEARRLQFSVKVKTNGVMIHEPEAARMRDLGVEQVQISVYSHRPEVHDAITKLPGSLQRTIQAIRFLKAQGLKVTIANVLMAGNLNDGLAVMKMARELGVFYTLDPTITPKMDGDTSILSLRIPGPELKKIFNNPELAGDVEEFCALPPKPGEDVMEGFPCSAAHTACYISPYGDVFPCVQFPPAEW